MGILSLHFSSTMYFILTFKHLLTSVQDYVTCVAYVFELKKKGHITLTKYQKPYSRCHRLNFNSNVILFKFVSTIFFFVFAASLFIFCFCFFCKYIAKTPRELGQQGLKREFSLNDIFIDLICQHWFTLLRHCKRYLPV